MKKVIALMLALSMAFALCACANKEEPKLEEPELELDGPQYFAAELLVEGVHLFSDPSTVKVKNVWYYQDGVVAYFTYKLEFEENGSTKTVYYGNRMGILDVDISNAAFHDENSKERLSFDSQLSDAKWLVNNSLTMAKIKGTYDNDYFIEDQVTAKENGVELDAEAIQKHVDAKLK